MVRELRTYIFLVNHLFIFYITNLLLCNQLVPNSAFKKQTFINLEFLWIEILGTVYEGASVQGVS